MVKYWTHDSDYVGSIPTVSQKFGRYLRYIMLIQIVINFRKMAEWSKAANCKFAGKSFIGSNPIFPKRGSG